MPDTPAEIQSNAVIGPLFIHRLITTALQMRDRAYVPYSDFRVGAALLCADGTIVGGCNVENASYGGTICAERTAITKAVSEGHRSFIACAVTSQLAEPSVSPCGICRQVLREFLPLDAPVFMASSTYSGSGSGDSEIAEPPVQLERCLGDFASGVLLAERETKVESEYGGMVRVWSLEELLPLSFGPDHLTRPRS